MITIFGIGPTVGPLTARDACDLYTALRSFAYDHFPDFYDEY